MAKFPKTKQGVRDLNSIPGKPKVVAEDTPKKIEDYCAHPMNMRRGNQCMLCGETIQPDG